MHKLHKKAAVELYAWIQYRTKVLVTASATICIGDRSWHVQQRDIPKDVLEGRTAMSKAWQAKTCAAHVYLTTCVLEGHLCMVTSFCSLWQCAPWSVSSSVCTASTSVMKPVVCTCTRRCLMTAARTYCRQRQSCD